MPEIVSRFVDVHVFRRRDDGEEWLLLKRAPHVAVPGAWGMVQGHIEPDEPAYHAAYRETVEETGLHPQGFWQASYVNRFYLAASDQIILSPVFCAELDADAAVALCEEHTDHRWVGVDEALRTYAWPGQRKSLQICREQFVLGTPRPESDVLPLVQVYSQPSADNE